MTLAHRLQKLPGLIGALSFWLLSVYRVHDARALLGRECSFLSRSRPRADYSHISCRAALLAPVRVPRVAQVASHAVPQAVYAPSFVVRLEILAPLALLP